jgi:carbon storage regulator CsrA
MLVLSRQINESIMIGDDVEVKITNIQKNNIEIQITHPKEVPVYPAEDYSLIKKCKADQKDEKLERQVAAIKKKWDNLNESRITRKLDESIRIGDDVEIVVIDIRFLESIFKARVGITAPKNISIHRREIYDAIQREKGTQKL